MSLNAPITTAEIKGILAEEIAEAGGRMQDCFDDGTRLYARTVLPWVSEVRPNDRVQGGVALRTTENDVWVHPYLFRQVCSNGQIITQALESQQIALQSLYTPEQARYAVHEAVRGCAAREAFDVPAQKMGMMPANAVDHLVALMPLLSKIPASHRMHMLGEISQRVNRERDRSQYGLLNAVTSLARDTRDPALRWQLEEAGGAMICGGVITSVQLRRSVRKAVYAGG